MSRGHLGQAGTKPHGIVGNCPSFLWQLGRHQQPSPTTSLLSDKAHSVWGGFEEPGHPAARPNPDQRGTPPCSWLRMVCSPQLTPPLPRHACSRVCACTGTLCGAPGLSASLSFHRCTTESPAYNGWWLALRLLGTGIGTWGVRGPVFFPKPSREKKMGEGRYALTL